MTKEEQFVTELIGYIFAYPDDDYMTMECLCRKLHKYGLIDKKDGEWTTDFIDRKTEPQICDICRYYNSNIPCGSTPSACKEADKFAEEFVDGLKKLKPTISKMEQVDKDINVRSKNEPQTNKDFKVTYTCSFTECDNFKNFGFSEKCIECKRKQSEAKHKDEPQTYITEDRDTQILDAWQVHHRNTTTVKDEPQTDCSWK